MRIEPVAIDIKNLFVKRYRADESFALNFFDYRPFGDEKKRLEELKERTFLRSELIAALKTMNEAWDAPKESLAQIERLQDANSVVVIGGQQAGLLTGPLYTLNKIVSILSYTKQQEEMLGVPVIPVFWIAGEDHDFAEINHIHIEKDGRLHKHVVGQQEYVRKSISTIKIDHSLVEDWLHEAFLSLRETAHTKEIHETIQSCLHISSTYVDFFARLIFKLFPNSGLVLFDSAHPEIRKIESSFFVNFIKREREIATSVYRKVQQLKQDGYQISLDVDEDDTNLFYHDDGERVLLKRVGSDWYGKNDEVKLTTEELIKTAENEPEKLSNNVVTRPMMQELLFPTIAFIAGDAEISYWAALKEGFRALDRSLKVPPIVPRLSMTFVTERIEKLLQTRGLDIKHVLNNGVRQEKVQWLINQKAPPLDVLFGHVKEEVKKLHGPIQEMAQTISDDLYSEAQKNLEYILQQIVYLEHRSLQKLEEKHNCTMRQFDEIEWMLKPYDVLQERIWCPLSFINEYGMKFIERMLKALPQPFENSHYIVFVN